MGLKLSRGTSLSWLLLAAAGPSGYLANPQVTDPGWCTDAFSYLYPQGRVGAPVEEVRITLPLRVGVGFIAGGVAPQPVWDFVAADREQQERIVARVAMAFHDIAELQLVEAIPTDDMRGYPEGFEALDHAAGINGMSLVVLISWDKSSFRYLGSLRLDAEVFDLASRAMVFSAGSTSVSSMFCMGKMLPGWAPFCASEEERGLILEQATNALISNLHISLDAFLDEVKMRQGALRSSMVTPRSRCE